MGIVPSIDVCVLPLSDFTLSSLTEPGTVRKGETAAANRMERLPSFQQPQEGWLAFQSSPNPSLEN